MKIIVDGDIVCYQAAAAAEKTQYLVEYAGEQSQYGKFDTAKSVKESTARSAVPTIVWSRKDAKPEADAIAGAQGILQAIRRALEAQPSDVVIVLTGTGNFRHKIATRADYKGNRSAERPKHYKAVREYLIELGAKVTSGEEADDAISILMTADPNSVCCSIDKDLRQIPGWHFNITTGELTAVSAREGGLNFFAQVLSGDTSDNIPGLTGIGAVKARKAIEFCLDPCECWDVCLQMYKHEFGKLGKRYALEAARLVYIRKQPGEMWQPPKASDPYTWHERVTVASPRKELEFSAI